MMLRFLCILVSMLVMSSCQARKKTDTEFEKYNAYINIVNIYTDTLTKSHRKYVAEFGDDQQPEVKKTFNGYDTGISDYDYKRYRNQLREALKFSENKTYDEQLEAYASEFCQLSLEYWDFMYNQVTEYYSHKDYDSDDFQNGNQFHRQILEGFQRISETYNNFYSLFKLKMEEKEGADLENLKEQGLLIHYHALSIIMQGKEIDRMFDEGQTINLERLEALVNGISTDIEQLNKHSGNDEQQKKEGLLLLQLQALDSFCENLNRFQFACSDLKRSAIDQAQSNSVLKTASTPLSRYKERLATIIKHYNSMVNPF